MTKAHPITRAQALAVVENEALHVPSLDNDAVCPLCFGSKVADYGQCSSCVKALQAGAPRDLLEQVVPLTITVSPGPWYSRMLGYKNASPEDSYYLSAVVANAFERFGDDMEQMLGGAPDLITITPSKQLGVSYQSQRLRKVLRVIEKTLPANVEPLLEHNGTDIPHNGGFVPEAFDSHEDAPDFVEARIVLVEDTWVTGATAISAAGKLLELGAESVMVLPIARLLEKSAHLRYFGKESEYLKAINAKWKAKRCTWPRA